jgi:hypothetical protein
VPCPAPGTATITLAVWVKFTATGTFPVFDAGNFQWRWEVSHDAEWLCAVPRSWKRERGGTKQMSVVPRVVRSLPLLFLFFFSSPSSPTVSLFRCVHIITCVHDVCVFREVQEVQVVLGLQPSRQVGHRMRTVVKFQISIYTCGII